MNGPYAQQLQPSITHLSRSGLDPISEGLILPSEDVVLLYYIAVVLSPTAEDGEIEVRISVGIITIFTQDVDHIHALSVHEPSLMARTAAHTNEGCTLMSFAYMKQTLLQLQMVMFSHPYIMERNL
uniref:Uncharacterized protein n=1 Tax=Timema genevievae TaxID=629358 RepID=A0A7R9K0C2_TIMGE|nr:unnamed protein product [Timema genevievae]